MNPRVKKVTPLPHYGLYLVFTNGERRFFDMRRYLGKGVFRKLKEQKKFAAARVSLGTVQWPGGQDLCPDTLYETSITADENTSQKFVKKNTYRRKTA